MVIIYAVSRAGNFILTSLVITILEIVTPESLGPRESDITERKNIERNIKREILRNENQPKKLHSEKPGSKKK